MPDTVERTTTDAWVFEATPSANYGQKARLHLDASSSNQRQAFISFGLPFNPGGDPNLTVFTATLKLYLSGAWPGSNTITVQRVVERWSENAITWANRPAIDNTHAATISVTGGSDGGLVTADLSNMLADVAAGAPCFGLRLSIGTSALRMLNAAEGFDQALRAVLEIDWSRTPLAPVNLSPSAGLAVSVAKPVLDWQFDSKDHSTQRKQAYSQVQVSTSSSFASPAYDSGQKANTLSSWDLSTASSPAFSALSSGDVRWWRVRVWDDRGQVSDWSDPVQFNRTTKGTLTISNPTSVVNETTPPVAFSLSGRVQEAIKIVLYQLDGTRLIERWTYGKRVTTDESVNIPANILNSREQWRVGVAAWDTVPRAVTQGDPDWVLATQDFTYQRAGSVAAVVNLTAVQGIGPGVLLTWHRTSSPLLFCLRIDDVEVKDDILPSDVYVSGDKYQMTYFGAVSGESHKYEIEALDVAAGQIKHSQGNDFDTCALDISAKWLVDDDITDPSVLEILNRDQASLAIRKSSTEYAPVSGQRDIEVIDAIGGYKGTISGKLANTAAKEKLELMVTKAKPLRFIQSTMNIPVEIRSEPNIAPSSEDIGDYYVVSVDIAQIGEFLNVPGV